MSAPGILLCLLIVLFLIGQIRVGCKAAYDHAGIQVWVRLGRFHIRVFPLKKKGEKPKKEKKPKKPKKKKEKPPATVGEKIGGALGYAQSLLPILLDAVKYFTHKLQVDKLHMTLIAGSPDPADAAMVYGNASAALGALWYPLVNAFDVKDGYAKVDLDFDAQQMTLCATAALSIKIGQILWFALYFGIRALVAFLRERKRQKNDKKLRKAV